MLGVNVSRELRAKFGRTRVRTVGPGVAGCTGGNDPPGVGAQRHAAARPDQPIDQSGTTLYRLAPS